MCESCEENKVLSGETKICKICGKEKPVEEFNSKGRGFRSAKCNVCASLIKKNINYTNSNWTYDEDCIIADYLINDRGRYINDLENILNDKNLREIVERISRILKIKTRNNIVLLTNCSNCGKTYNIRLYDYLKDGENFCSKPCSSSFKRGKNYHKIIGNGNCLYCDTKFDIYSNVPNQKFCSSKCKTKFYLKNNMNKTNTQCSNCGKEILKTKSQVSKYSNNFCSLECELEYKYKASHEFRICEICGDEFEVIKSSSQRFCSVKCQCTWQSNNLRGENASGYKHEYTEEDRTVKCDWCDKEIKVKPSKINQERHFCNDECRQSWYANVFSQSDEWRETSRKRAVKILESGVISKTESNPQIIINNILNQLNIKYKTEYNCTYYAIDNYLEDYNLMIEVMGTYWHCDNRKYKTINYKKQADRIKTDKAKRTYIMKKYNIKILYLWEKDIIENPELIIELIKEYVSSKGIIKNYHSFNYSLEKNNILKLNKKLIIPYMDWNIKKLNDIIDLSVIKKKSKRQEDKWMKFNCEYCGKETERLYSHYKKSEHHFCSVGCGSKFRHNKS